MSVTIKNTKNEILEALNAVKLENEKLKSIQFKPTEVIDENQNINMINTALEDVKNNIFSDEINNKLLNITKAIEFQNERLKDLYDIEDELLDLTTIVNSKKALIDKLDADFSNKKEEIKIDFDKISSEYKEKENSIKKQFEEYKDNLEVQRLRENDEYNYNINRQREKDNDEWNDEKVKRELLISTKEDEVKKSLEEPNGKSEYIKNLEIQVSELQNKIKEIEDAFYNKGKSEAGKEYGYEKNMYIKEFGYKEKDYNNTISRLTEDLERERELNKSINEKLDNAYKEIRDLANKTVEHTSGVKVISGFNNEVRK